MIKKITIFLYISNNMTKLSKKQNDILGVMGINHVYSDTPINRTKIETVLQDKHLLLENLVTRIKT